MIVPLEDEGAGEAGAPLRAQYVGLEPLDVEQGGPAYELSQSQQSWAGGDVRHAAWRALRRAGAHASGLAVAFLDSEPAASPKAARLGYNGLSGSAPNGVRGGNGHNHDDDDDDDDAHGWLSSSSNLDDFFSRVYGYYYERGFPTVVAKGVVNTLTLGFTVVFSTFLLGFVSWSELLTCNDEASCHDFGHYVVSLSAHPSLFFRAFVVLYCLVFSLFWAWTVSSLVPSIRSAWEIRQFYERRLGISTRELQTMEWSSVVDRMIALQEQGDRPIQINGLGFSAKDVAMRVMRRQNYLVALVNEEILPVGTTMFGPKWFLGKNLELMLELCVLQHMFDANFQLRRDFVGRAGAKRLRRRFRLFGLLSLAVMPFSLGFMFIYSFLKYAEEFHSKRNYLGKSYWSVFALWEFREYNEVAHLFERRAVAAMPFAEQYLRQFPSPVPTVLAGGVSFVAGAFVGVLLLFTLLDESILLHIKLDDRNLVWYIAVFSGILAISRSLVPPLQDTVFNPDKAMRRVVAYSHFLPDRWREQTHTYDVRDEFADYFQYRALLLLRELLCIVSTPFVLLLVLPNYAGVITEFVQARTVSVPGIGDVCCYSLLQLDIYGDERYHQGDDCESDVDASDVDASAQRQGADQNQSQSQSQSQSQEGDQSLDDGGQSQGERGDDVDIVVGGERRGYGRVASGPGVGRFVSVSRRTSVQGGKLEKSWLNFKLNYPNWEDAQTLDSQLAAFQRSVVGGATGGGVGGVGGEGAVGVGDSGFGMGLGMGLGMGAAGVGAGLDAAPSSMGKGKGEGESEGAARHAGFKGAASLSSLSSSVEQLARNPLGYRDGHGGGGGRAGESGGGGGGRVLSASADHGYFAEADAMLHPLDTVKYPNSESYYYWLESFRDSRNVGGDAGRSPPGTGGRPRTDGRHGAGR